MRGSARRQHDPAVIDDFELDDRRDGARHRIIGARQGPRADPERYRQAAEGLGLCTTAFALGQAVAAYGFSYIFARAGDYHLLYGIAAAALAAALAIDMLTGSLSTKQRRAMFE
jgi:hypothetical protein